MKEENCDCGGEESDEYEVDEFEREEGRGLSLKMSSSITIRAFSTFFWRYGEPLKFSEGVLISWSRANLWGNRKGHCWNNWSWFNRNLISVKFKLCYWVPTVCNSSDVVFVTSISNILDASSMLIRRLNVFGMWPLWSPPKDQDSKQSRMSHSSERERKTVNLISMNLNRSFLTLCCILICLNDSSSYGPTNNNTQLNDKSVKPNEKIRLSSSNRVQITCFHGDYLANGPTAMAKLLISLIPRNSLLRPSAFELDCLHIFACQPQQGS